MMCVGAGSSGEISNTGVRLQHFVAVVKVALAL